MSLAFISFIGSEADIAEDWLRYHARFARVLRLVTHHSDPETLTIIRRLQEEGLPIVVSACTDKAYNQADALNALLPELLEDEAIEWIMPLDADEFLRTPRPIWDVLAELPQDRVTRIPWRTYIPTASDDATAPMPGRTAHRLSSEPHPHAKVLLPAAMLRRVPGTLRTGNHAYVPFAPAGGGHTPHTEHELSLAHFPVRGERQLRGKIIAGCAALRSGGFDERICYQWRKLERRCLDDTPFSAGELRDVAARYLCDEECTCAPAIIRDPLPTDIHVPHPDGEFAFYMQIYGDEDLAAAALRRLRSHYPVSRVILCSDGGDAEALMQLANAFGAEAHAGERLYESRHGGALWLRALDLFLQKPAAFLIKIDTDTRFDRVLRVHPHPTTISGDRSKSSFVQGGCIIIPFRVAERLARSGLLASATAVRWTLTQDALREPWLRRPGPPRMSSDRFLHWAAGVLGIAATHHPEVRSQWMEMCENADRRYAVVHPDKFLQYEGALRSALIAAHQASCGLLMRAQEQPPQITKKSDRVFRGGLFVGFRGNMGDELMFRAAAQHFHRANLDYRIAPRAEDEVLLDASGYHYGAPWGRERLHAIAAGIEQWKSEGKRIVLLPQSFGPFVEEADKRAMATILRHADRVYAREPSSYIHLHPLAGRADVLRLAPDFTIDVPGTLPPDMRPRPRSIAVVPNRRMLDQTESAARDAYIPFLLRAMRIAVRYGYAPFLLLHETKDEPLCEDIRARFGGDLPLVKHDDAQVVKGIIGACDGLIGARYHALLSALSQGVPALGTQWHPKYAGLYELYGCPDLLLDLPATDEQIEGAMASLCSPDKRPDVLRRLSLGVENHQKLTRAMWDDVDAVLRERTREVIQTF